MADAFRDSLNRTVDHYLLGLLPPRDPVLARMEAHAVEKGFPFIGALVGELLEILTAAVQAKRVFELGSGFGFSALHFARALPEDGRLICTDGDPQNARLAMQFFCDAGLERKLGFHVGDAVSILQQTDGLFDIILMDIDKEGYADAFRVAWPRVRPGGLFIADNLLWHGRVLGDDDAPSTRGVREFTRLLYATPDARTSILPLRDGVSVTRKTA